MMENFLKQDLEQALQDMEMMAKALDIAPFDVYLLGGSGCVLAGYFNRATRDFDFMDLEYDAKLGRVFKLLEPYDMIDPQLATIPPTYKNRATRLVQFVYLPISVLSREDIIISKMARLDERDLNDISILLQSADIRLIFELAGEIAESDLLPKAKAAFIENFSRCMEENHVPDYLQQLEELRKRF